jgi:hypothetical protein
MREKERETERERERERETDLRQIAYFIILTGVEPCNELFVSKFKY